MMPCAGGDPEHAPAGDVEVIERVSGTTLADHERDARGEDDRREPEDQGSRVRDGCEVDPQHERRDQHHGQEAAEVIDGIGPLVYVSGNVPEGEEQGHDGEGEGEEEHRAPPVMLEEQSRKERAERRDCPTESRPQRDRLRPARSGPERGDERQRRRVGHACREPATQPSDEQHDVGRGKGGQKAHRDRERCADQQHRLATVPVAQGAEIQHRAREAERVSNRDQVQRRLRALERGADIRQRDVGHGEVQVGDGSNQDQRRKHEVRVWRRGRGAGSRR